MYLNRKLIIILAACLALGACSSFKGAFGLGFIGDKKDYARARDLYSHGHYEQAIEELSAYIHKTYNVKRREARAYRLLGMSYEQTGQLSKALDTYLEALEFHPKNVPLLLAAADLYQRTGLTDRSIELYELALQEEPDNLSALAGQAENYRAMGFYSKARDFYDRFFTLNPQASAQYRARYADTFLNQHNYESAFINITMALEQDDSSPDFWLISARANFGLGRTEEALKDIDIALSFSPVRRDLLGTKALMLYHNKQYDLSMQTAQQILDLYPENQLGLFIKALNLKALGNAKQAAQILQQITALNPHSFIGKTADNWQTYHPL